METEGKYCYKYPRPAVTTDCVILGWDGNLKVLLIERGRQPFRGCWAFPGGFLEMEEDAEACARRELEEETGLKAVELQQLHTFSAVDRDPRYRVISIAYYALVPLEDCRITAGDDAAKALWFPVNTVPELAFDHSGILQATLVQLRQKSRHYPIGKGVLPAAFTMDELQQFYEAVEQRPLDSEKFRQWILGTGILDELKAAGYSQKCYHFNPEQYELFSREGFGYKSVAGL